MAAFVMLTFFYIVLDVLLYVLFIYKGYKKNGNLILMNLMLYIGHLYYIVYQNIYKISRIDRTFKLEVTNKLLTQLPNIISKINNIRNAIWTLKIAWYKHNQNWRCSKKVSKSCFTRNQLTFQPTLKTIIWL